MHTVGISVMDTDDTVLVVPTKTIFRISDGKVTTPSADEPRAYTVAGLKRKLPSRFGRACKAMPVPQSDSVYEHKVHEWTTRYVHFIHGTFQDALDTMQAEMTTMHKRMEQMQAQLDQHNPLKRDYVFPVSPMISQPSDTSSSTSSTMPWGVLDDELLLPESLSSSSSSSTSSSVEDHTPDTVIGALPPVEMTQPFQDVL